MKFPFLKHRKHVARYVRAAKDPDYTVSDAISDYMKGNPQTAISVGRQYLCAVDPEDPPMTWKEFERLLDSMSPRDAFYAGTSSTRFDRRDKFVCFDGSGFGTVSEDAFLARCVELGDDEDFVTAVICGEIRIPSQMADVLSLFVDRRDLSISHDITGKLKTATRKAKSLRSRVRRPIE